MCAIEVVSPARELLEAKQIADLAEESVACSSQILESEFTRFLQRRPISEVNECARDGPIAE
jgi:hypothetical protein